MWCICGARQEHIRLDSLGRRITKFSCGWTIIDLAQGTISLSPCKKLVAYLAKYDKRKE